MAGRGRPAEVDVNRRSQPGWRARLSRMHRLGSEAIALRSPDPEVVYVPQYNPETVYVKEEDRDEGHSTTTLVTTALRAFAGGVALGAIFNDDDDDWYDDDYYYYSDIPELSPPQLVGGGRTFSELHLGDWSVCGLERGAPAWVLCWNVGDQPNGRRAEPDNVLRAGQP